MDTTELTSFLAVAKFRSFSKASTHLGIPQPTLTAHVKRLEADLGRILLDRTTIPVTLTPSGGRLWELMESAYDHIDRGIRRISDGEIENSIVVATTPVVANHILPFPVKAFLSSNPEVHLQIRIYNPPEALEAIFAGEADLGIFAVGTRDPRFDFKSLYGYSWSIIAPQHAYQFKSRSLTLTDLADKPLILPRSRVSPMRKTLDEMFQKAGLVYQIAVEVDNYDCAKRFVQDGIGISLLPQYAIYPSDHGFLQVLRFRVQLPVQYVTQITVAGKKPPSLVEKFEQVLQSTLSRIEREELVNRNQDKNSGGPPQAGPNSSASGGTGDTIAESRGSARTRT